MHNSNENAQPNESDKTGVIKAIIAENAQPVEFNQVYSL